ncbi:histidine phosphatase family protein [Qaidamihabitans albus]|uniref:histidine phosphatase family protein n=1 Tax=Qaidamihabitans albus TaxID=2795733 RepID=UPI0018F15BA6|nr:histidine phosphatase family protein [Qaidamihabitans albus]
MTTHDEPEYRQSRFRPPPGATRFLLIRHGESAPARASSLFPLVGGQGDPELAPDGRVQADRIGARLAGKATETTKTAQITQTAEATETEAIDAIYVTTLRRTVQTAAPLAERLGLEPVVEPDLREVHLGDWEGGLLRKHYAENHPVAQRLRTEQRWDIIPNAEAAEEFEARVRGAIERLAAAHPDQRLAVFTHGGVIGQALALASGSQPFAFVGADNGSISEIVIAGQAWILRRFNDTAHLTG